MNALGKATLPNLKRLDLGIYLLFCNACTNHQQLGDITGVLQKHNKIERLSLGGDFQLTQPILFKHLKMLTIEGWISDDVSVQMSNEAWLALTDCDMPALIEADIDLEHSEVTYTFSNRFLNKETFPHLKKLDLCVILPDNEWEKIENSNLARTPILILTKYK